MTDWYYKKPYSNFEFGPLSDEALKNAYLEEKIDMDTLITNDGMKKWVVLRDFKPLYDVFCKIARCKMDTKVSKLEEKLQRKEVIYAEDLVSPEHRSIWEYMQQMKDQDAERSIVKVLLSFGFNHIDPIKFEELILRVFESLGFKGSLTPRSGDDGIDILLTDKREKRVIIQCKRYNDNQTISPKDVREFLGSMSHAKAEYAFFVTTSSFSENAKEFCKDKSIYLVDGEKLKRLFLLAIRADFLHISLGHEYFENQQNGIKNALSPDSNKNDKKEMQS